ncbi:uncharacterized protein [Nicotiana sylvestris]|uniref:Uncharacterized protein LOC104233513 n=1 Tax=Nicotiana sylvestris TaxID=4096 RepID=A0A1U7X307_NICSY|nr:PREDICTED: uncharacterized protein LOC104233513 [Nicotiana sylvestris]
MDGRKIADPVSIKEEFISFYKNLMGSSAKSLPAINKEIMQNGPKLTHDQQLSLITEVTEDEKSLAYSEAKGSASSSGIFHYWQDLQSHKLYNKYTCASKNRLQRVIASVISEAQAGFIPGRKISDNIILSHELVKAYTRKNFSPRCMIKIDLTKAYDFVEWIFLEEVMVELGFPSRF